MKYRKGPFIFMLSDIRKKKRAVISCKTQGMPGIANRPQAALVCVSSCTFDAPGMYVAINRVVILIKCPYGAIQIYHPSSSSPSENPQ